MIPKFIKKFFRSRILAGQIRHIATGLAGYLVTLGIIAEGDAPDAERIIAGAAVYVVSAIWSLFDKADNPSGKAAG